MSIKITMTQDGKAKIYTPYNTNFVARVKTAGGRWDADGKCWTVPADAVEVVRGILRDVYGMDDSPAQDAVRIRLTFAKRVAEYGAAVTILGHTVSRAYGRDSGARPGDGVYYEAGKPTSGGSAKNWASVVAEGSVVVLAAVPRAMLERGDLPDGVTAEVMPASPTIDRAALANERERLAARLAEIDAILAADGGAQGQ